MKGRMKRLSRRKKFFFSIVTVLLIFTGMEGVLRFAGFEYDTVPSYISFRQEGYMFGDDKVRTFERDDHLFWRLVPNNPRMGINPQGFRGRPFKEERDPGMKRIVCLGCSVTFGLYEPKAYAYFLEEQLNTCGGKDRVEVYNMGVPGYSSFQGLRLLKSRAMDFNPDLVIAAFGWNDHWLIMNRPDKEQKPRPWTVKALSASRLYQLLHRTWWEFREQNLDVGVRADDVRVSLTDFEENLRKMASRAREKGANTLFVTLPTSIIDREDTPGYLIRDGLLDARQDLPSLHASYNEATRRVAKEVGAFLADCDRVLSPDVRALTMRDGIHPNEDGHRRIAKLIHDILAESCPELWAAGSSTEGQGE